MQSIKATNLSPTIESSPQRRTMMTKRPLLRNAISETYIRECQSVLISSSANTMRQRFDMMVKTKGSSDSCLETSPSGSRQRHTSNQSPPSARRGLSKSKGSLQLKNTEISVSSQASPTTSPKRNQSRQTSRRQVKKLEQDLDQDYLALIRNQAETIQLRMKIMDEMIKLEETSKSLRRESEKIINRKSFIEAPRPSLRNKSNNTMKRKMLSKSYSAPQHNLLLQVPHCLFSLSPPGVCPAVPPLVEAGGSRWVAWLYTVLVSFSTLVHDVSFSARPSYYSSRITSVLYLATRVANI